MSKKILAKTDGLSKEDWLKLRKMGLGGSDSSVVCGLNRWKSQLELWLDKTSNEIIDEQSEPIIWGSLLEPVIRSEFSKRIGKEVKKMPYMFQSVEYPFMIANVDGVLQEDDGSHSLVEIKTVSSYKAQEWLDGVPCEYYIQVQHYIAVTGVSRAYIVYLIGGNELHWQIIDRDDDTISMIIALEADFWHKVQNGIRPDIDNKSAKGLDTLYPVSKKEIVELSEEANSLVEEYFAIKSIEEDVKSKKAELENKLKALLGENETGNTSNGYRVNWKSATTNRLDTNKLKADCKELAEKYTLKSSTRRFSVSKCK